MKGLENGNGGLLLKKLYQKLKNWIFGYTEKQLYPKHRYDDELGIYDYYKQLKDAEENGKI